MIIILNKIHYSLFICFFWKHTYAPILSSNPPVRRARVNHWPRGMFLCKVNMLRNTVYYKHKWIGWNQKPSYSIQNTLFMEFLNGRNSSSDGLKSSPFLHDHLGNIKSLPFTFCSCSSISYRLKILYMSYPYNSPVFWR